MYFAMMAWDVSGAAEVRRGAKERHVRHLDAAAVNLKVLQSGPLLDEIGGEVGSLVIVEAPDRATVENFASRDPYAEAGLLQRRLIQPWSWRRGNPYLVAAPGGSTEIGTVHYGKQTSGNSQGDAVSQIQAMEDARFAAVLAADTDALETILHDGLVYMHSSGVADDKRSYIAGISTGLWVYRRAERSEQRVEVQGDLALVFNRLRLDLQSSGVEKDVDARALSVWFRESGRWRLLGVQSGPIPAEAG